MIIDSESEVLSDVEVILPREVMETCRDLQQGGTSCFLSVNKQDCTTSQLIIHKLHDDSIKIRITVMALGSNVDEHKQGDDVHEKRSDIRQEDGVLATGEDSEVENLDRADSLGYKRRSLKGKPRIPSAIDTSRLNKHLTNIWSSKRKKPAKKSAASSLSDDSTLARGSDVQMESDHMAPDESALLNNSQASTVIIVKTLPQKESDSYHTPAKVNKVSEALEVQKGSRDIAERLKARKQRFAASLGGSSVDASMNRSGEVTCELCAETVTDYAHLVQHVCQQHEDCTYVRSYLDEIQPIAEALSAVSLPCKACGKTFAGQAALAAHRHECDTVGHVSKLGAHRKQITASLLSPSEHATPGRQNAAARIAPKPSRKSAGAAGGRDHKCAHCKRTFSSQDNLAKHVSRVHKQKDLKPAKVGRRAKPPPTKSAAVPGSKVQQPAGHSGQLSVSGSTGQTGGQFQRCDHCNAQFSRTSLLVTHMRYCLKADANK